MGSGYKIFQKVLEFKEISRFYVTSQTSHCMRRNTNTYTQLVERFREMHFLLGIPKNYSIRKFKIYKPQISLKKLEPIFFIRNG
jgi:hypothetical protein